MAVRIKTFVNKLEVPLGSVSDLSISGADPDDNGTGVNWYGNDEVGFVNIAGVNKLTLSNSSILKHVAGLAAGNDLVAYSIDRTSPVTTAKYTSIDFTGNNLVDKMLTLRAVTASAGNHGFQLKTASSGAFNTLPALSVLSNNNVGINIASPQFPLHLAKAGEVTQAAFVDTSLAVFSSESDDSPGLTINSYSIQNTTRAVLKGVKAKGTTTAPTAVTDTNYTLSLLGAGYDGTSNLITAAIDFQVAGTPSTGVMPQAIIFRNSNTTGLTERMRITPTGNVGIGSANAGSKLAVTGGVTIGGGYNSTAISNTNLAVQGMIGVGTTSPAALVNTAGSTGTQIQMESAFTGSAGVYLAFKDGLTSPSHRIGVAAGIYTFQVNGTTRADLKSDGFRYAADYSATWTGRSLVDKDYVDGLIGGGGGATDLTFAGSASPVTLESSTGTDVIFTAGTNVAFSQVGNNLTISATGGGGATDLTFSGASSPVTLESSTGTDVDFIAGTGITLSQAGNALTITNSAAGAALTGVLDQVNMLDISAPGGVVQIAPNIPEGTLENTYSATDTFMFYDASATAHRQGTIGTYFGNGFVDKLNTQVDIAGDKGFTTSIHYGAASLPTSSNFGTTVGTNVYFASTTTAITETNFNNSQGLIFHNKVDNASQYQNAYIIAAGTDAAGGKASEIDFKVRPAGAGQNWIEPMRIMGTNQVLFGNGNLGGAVGGQIQLYASGGGSCAWLGGLNDWSMGTTTNGVTTFYVAENGTIRDYISAGVSGWVIASDIRLKENIETLTVLPYINSFRGVSYNMKDNPDKRTIGVIAQEIEEYFPEAVAIPDNEEEMKGVRYSAIAAIALQGVKELKQYIDMLERRITALEKQLKK